jgi:hypothetical protein
VTNIGKDILSRAVDDGAVTGIDLPDVQFEQSAQRRQIRRHVTTVHRNDGGTGPEDEIPREKDSVVFEVIAQVVDGVARREDGLNC